MGLLPHTLTATPVPSRASTAYKLDFYPLEIDIEISLTDI